MSRDYGREGSAARDDTLAADRRRQGARERDDPRGPPAELEDMSAVSSVVGRHLFTRSGSYVGDVVELLLDLPSATVRYAVVVPGGPWGLDKRWLCVPFELLRYDVEHEAFVLTAGPAALSAARCAAPEVRRLVLGHGRSSPV